MTLHIRFLALLSFFVFASFSVKADNPRKTKATIKTSAECKFCKQTIEEDLKKVKGIKKVKVDFVKHEVYVTFNATKITLNEIKITLTKMGYDADELKAHFEKYKVQ